MDQIPQTPSQRKFSRREMLLLLAGAAGAALTVSQNPDQVFAQTPAPTQEVMPNEKPKLMQFEGEFKRFDEENIEIKKLLQDISLFLDSPEFNNELMEGSMLGFDSVKLDVNVDGKVYIIKVTRDITGTTNRVYTIFIKNPVTLRSITDKVEAKKLLETLVKNALVNLEKFEAAQSGTSVLTFTQTQLNDLNAMGGNNFPGFDLRGRYNANAYFKYNSKGTVEAGKLPVHDVQVYIKAGDNADFFIVGKYDPALGGQKYYIIGRPFQQDEAGNVLNVEQFQPINAQYNTQMEEYLLKVEKLTLAKVRKKAENIDNNEQES